MTSQEREAFLGAYLAAIVASSNDAIIGNTLEGSVESWNLAAERIYGYAAEEMLGKSISVLVPPNRQDEVPRLLEKVKRGELIDRYETLQLTKDGRQINVELTISPVENHDGNTISAAMIARDVTERKLVEGTERKRVAVASQDALQTEQDESEYLREVDRLKDDFLSTVSHELRTPLTSISTFVQVLRDSPVLDEATSRDVLNRIYGNVGEMTQMIEQLLDFSRLQAGRVDLSPESLSLQEIVDQSISAAGQSVGGWQLVVEIPAGLKVVVDRGGFERILVNLLTNAVKFSPADTTVRIGAIHDGSKTTVSVKDEGSGIPVNEQVRIFERFYQGSIVSGKRGTGVGLNIVQAYVELQGGRVWVESQPDLGSTFFFTLPSAPSEK